MPRTNQQQAFVDTLTGTTRHVALIARAGCGKTTTILDGVDAVAHPRKQVLVAAFNKAIADEVREKLQARGHTDFRCVQAATLHSLGYRLVQFVFKAEVDDKKVRKLVTESNLPITAMYASQVTQLVRMAKQSGFGFFHDLPIESYDAWYKLADHYDINGLDDTQDMHEVVAAAMSIYRQSLRLTSTVDYDDMILFPLIHQLRVKFTKDYIFLDEAQDLSRTRQALARKFLTPLTGRMIIVGDDRQAIYGFSGADAEALDTLSSSLDAVRLPLTFTWRCPQAVVELAQTLVPDIQAAPSAPAGSVTYTPTLPTPLMPSQDAILCRNTSPLISIAYTLLAQGVPVRVEGRDIGEGLIELVTRWKIKTIPALLNKLSLYKEREQQKALARGNERKVEEIEDKVASIIVIANALTAQGKHSISDVVDFIDQLFADDTAGVVTLCTYHRSKGREWHRVMLIEHAKRCPSKYARQQWQKDQEDNLAYVAFTRAKDSLVFVA